jgi:pimeloyl-ACP methyl ester carboxylesterase
MSKIVAFSGWGQAHDALANVTPAGTIHIDYSKFPNTGALFAFVKDLDPDVVIGWSLGGQLSLRAISEGLFKPRSLVLLATPYQFVASKDIKCAMDRDTFNIFHANFKHDPVKIIKRFITLISLNDSHIHEILSTLRKNIETEGAERWLYWLEELERFSCNLLDFSQMPKTYSIHGRDDTIVDITQTGLFKPLIADYRLEVFDTCGHAPHLHDEVKVRDIISTL